LNATRFDFGPTLKARREERGVTLQAIADSTKISLSLLTALERNDLSRWPRGIFRRAYFRDYVTAIGLPPEPLLTEFIRLFPDEPSAEPADENEPVALTLALDVDVRADTRRAWLRVAAAIGELAAVLAMGAAAAHVFAADLWTSSGVIGLIYYPVANICVERRLRVRGLSLLMTSRPFRRVSAPSSRQESGDGEITRTPELRTVSN
jgi:transcriptional regulator with XRE-family HTH domain